MERLKTDAEMQEEAKQLIDQALKLVHDIEHEPFSVVTTEYINALRQLHDGILIGTWGQFNDVISRVVIDSNKLVLENAQLRQRLKDAFHEILKTSLKSNAFSMGRAYR